MTTNSQTNEEPDVEQYFPGEEPFSRKKRERQRQVALYLTLIVGAALLIVGVTLRYTLLAEAYKPDPYQPSVASVPSEVTEETAAIPETVRISSSRPMSGSTAELPGKLRETYFSDAPGGSAGIVAPATPAPEATPSSLLPDTVDTANRTFGEPVAVGTVVNPIEMAPMSSGVTPSIRLFELPSREQPETPKLPAIPQAPIKPGTSRATPEPPGGLKVNITAPNITTVPGMLPPRGSKLVQPGSTLPGSQPETPSAPAPETSPVP